MRNKNMNQNIIQITESIAKIEPEKWIRVVLEPMQALVNTGNNMLYLSNNESTKEVNKLRPNSSFTNVTDDLIKIHIYNPSVSFQAEISVFNGGFIDSENDTDASFYANSQTGVISAGIDLLYTDVASFQVSEDAGVTSYLQSISAYLDDAEHGYLDMIVYDSSITTTEHYIFSDSLTSGLVERDFSNLNNGRGLKLNPGSYVKIRYKTSSVSYPVNVVGCIDILEES